jgi:hypothetical protein
MVQIRIMHDDAGKVRDVAELPLMRASGLLMVGDETELPNRRGDGLRIVVEVTPAPGARQAWAEQAGPGASSPPPASPSGTAVPRGPIALPPAAPRSRGRDAR